MKKAVLIFIAAMVFIGCSVNNKSKAIDLVESNVTDEVIGDFQYSNLDSLFSSVHDNETYIANAKNLREARNKLSKARKDSIDEIRYTGNSGMFNGLIKLYSESVEEYETKEKTLRDKFISEFVGYKFYQVYKHKTSFGDSIKFVRYDFNKDITQIIDMYAVQIDGSLESEVYKNGSVFSNNILDDLERLSSIHINVIPIYLDEGGEFGEE